MNRMKTSWKVLMAVAMLALGGLSSCSSSEDLSDTSTDQEDSNNEVSTVQTQKGPYFIGVKTSAADGAEYVIQTTSINEADLNINQNQKALEQTDYTWIFHQNTAVGLAYGYASAGYGYAMRLQSEDSKFEDLYDFRIEPRYTSYGFFNDKLITMVGGLTATIDGQSRNDLATFTYYSIDSDGVKVESQHTLLTENITGNGQQITFSGVADNGDGTFMTAVIQSDFHQAAANDGSSIGLVKYPDSCWIAKMDKDMNILGVYDDDRISFAAGRWHSQLFTQIFKTDNQDTTYVFSSAIDSTTTHAAGAIRFTAQQDGFDNYYWNIQEDLGGYKFRRVWHVTDDIYLLEVYNDFNPGNTSIAHVYYLADMSEKRLTAVTGLPAKNRIRSGEETGSTPLYDEGVLWLPITEYGYDAALYGINPYTGVATKGITITGCREIRSIGRLQTNN